MGLSLNLELLGEAKLVSIASKTVEAIPMTINNYFRPLSNILEGESVDELKMACKFFWIYDLSFPEFDANPSRGALSQE